MGDHAITSGGSCLGRENTCGIETRNNASQAILITLLTVNSVLVVAVLAMGGMWIADRRTSGSPMLRNSYQGYEIVG
jgi:hypothetical protein